jgi:hypothetical protein
MNKQSFYNGYTYVDTMNREATQYFIELTHEKYKKSVGQHFGKSIKGIFTDEPHRGSLMDGFGIQNEHGEWHAPWTPQLFDAFQHKFGYDLVSKLPELFLWPNGHNVSQVKWHYTELLQTLFIENFAKPIQAWCNENNLILTGHVLHEDNLTAQVVPHGSVMRFYEHMEYPGVDVLTEGNVNFWIAKQLSSAARQLGKKWLLSELYGCTGWQMSLEGHKAVGIWQTLFGINLRCHHLSWYTMEGESKRDFPASISHQSAWWKDYDYVETFFSRLGVIMTHGQAQCEILVLNPVESVWCQIYPGWSKKLAVQSPEVKRLEKIYADTFHWISGAQMDFDYGDEEMLGRLACIQYNKAGQPILKFGEATYSTVVITGMLTIRSTTLQLLQQFVDAGGKVIFAGEPPAYVDALPNQLAANLASQASQIPMNPSILIDTLQHSIHQSISVRDSRTGDTIHDIYCQVRTDEHQTYVVLLNVNRNVGYEHVSISIQAQGVLEEWRCDTGERWRIKTEHDGNAMQLYADFPPNGEHVFVIVHETDTTIPVVFAGENLTEIVMDGPYAYSLHEPNVCVLDFASFQFQDGVWQAEQEILKVDQAIRQQLGLPYRGGEMIQPWFANQFAPNHFEPLGKLRLRFGFHVQALPEEPIHLVIERPERYVISLNGHLILKPEKPDYWVDQVFKKIAIPLDALKMGENTIELETQFHQGVDLEAIYLIGSFGVRLSGTQKMIDLLPMHLFAGDIAGQGLPFYSGTLSYHISGEQMKAYDSENVSYHLLFSEFAGAAVKVSSANSPAKVIAWQPYEADITTEVLAQKDIEVQLVLTRRNTFGPLHLVPTLVQAYGPDHYITEGEHYSDSYALVQAGLMTQPRMVIRTLTNL